MRGFWGGFVFESRGNLMVALILDAEQMQPLKLRLRVGERQAGAGWIHLAARNRSI
jgi:hypothetical protein